jgi:negative regulator of flagellin synthesis FlgM
MTYTSAIESSGQFSNDPSVTSTTTIAIPASARTEAATRAASPSRAIDSIASDSAKVSLAGAMLSKASTGSDVRFDKIAALQQSMEAGTYGVTSATLAGKLIDSLQH